MVKDEENTEIEDRGQPSFPRNCELKQGI